MASGDIQFTEDFNGWQTLEPTPFFPQVKPYFVPHTEANAGSWGDLNGVGITFNQAYILNTTTTGGALTIDRSKILNMDEEWVIKNKDGENQHNEYDKKTVNFVVEIIRDSDSLDVIRATFTGITGDTAAANALIAKGWHEIPVHSEFAHAGVKGGYPRPVTAELDDNDLWFQTYLDPYYEGKPLYQEPYTGYIPVCQIFRGELQSYSLRDNIHIGERQLKQMPPRDKMYEHESPNGWYLVDCTGYRPEDELFGITEDPEWNDSGWGGTGSAGVMSLGNFDPSSLYFKDVAPMMFRSIVGGTGVSISPFENTIVIDTYGGGNAIPWSGKCCGPNQIDTYCVYKEQIGLQDGTHDRPAVFRKITGANGITVNFGDSNDANDADGDDCLIVISGADGGMPWSGENCGRDGTANRGDAPWALTQGVNAAHSRAKNVYKAYTADQDGTHANPAVFRRLSGDRGGNSKYGPFYNGGVTVDYDSNEDCLIKVSGHLWSGMNCIKDGKTDADYDNKAYNVYVPAGVGEQNGIHQNPAVFRRLSGAGTVTIQYDAEDDCLISISGECCSGVENAGSIPEVEGTGGARVYRDGNDPAILRRLVGKHLLADQNGDSMVKEYANDFIYFSGIWTGRNVNPAVGQPVYKATTDGTVDGSLANPADFYTLKGEDGIEVNLRNDAFGYPNYLEISGTANSATMWSGLNTGDCSDPDASIYVDGTGPSYGNKALFRKLKGARTTTSPDNGTPQISVIEQDPEDGSCIVIRGNDKDGYILVPRMIVGVRNDDGYVTGLRRDGYVQFEWKDGLMIGLTSDDPNWETAQTGSIELGIE